jgi:hypothetical protein
MEAHGRKIALRVCVTVAIESWEAQGARWSRFGSVGATLVASGN